jgi:Transglutaminase-like superfamily
MPPARFERIPDIVRKIRYVPDDVRRFATTATAAHSRHRIGAEILDELVAAGLPVLGSGEDRLFDDYDISNAALHLGVMSVQRMALRSWAHALRRNDGQEHRTARIGFAPRCPAPGHPEDCRFDLLRPGGTRHRVHGVGNGTDVLACLQTEVHGCWPTVPAAVRDLVEEVADVDFFLLPEVIRWDPESMLAIRAADCGAVARWLVDEGNRRGLPARFSFGLLVVSPYSAPHCWAEFRAEGVWVPVDPLLLGAMRPHGLAGWPAHRSTGAIVARLTDRFTKLASHGGIWAPLSLPTQYLT